MAFLLPKISPPPLLPHSTNSPAKPSSHLPATLTKLEPPPSLDVAGGGNLTVSHHEQQRRRRRHQESGRDDFYLNLGLAVRTLRSDIPSIFSRDLNYDIYRDDITFIDPLNTFHGIENYKLIFWALRFHGRILFSEIGVEIFRIWQPSDTSILIRWELRGTPRVPWEAHGKFQGTSRYKLDREGKIYEHKIDNLAFNFPLAAVTPATVLDLVVVPATPNMTFGLEMFDCRGSCSWLELYRAVRGTMDHEGRGTVGPGVERWLTCS